MWYNNLPYFAMKYVLWCQLVDAPKTILINIAPIFWRDTVSPDVKTGSKRFIVCTSRWFWFRHYKQCQVLCRTLTNLWQTSWIAGTSHTGWYATWSSNPLPKNNKNELAIYRKVMAIQMVGIIWLAFHGWTLSISRIWTRSRTMDGNF